MRQTRPTKSHGFAAAGLVAWLCAAPAIAAGVPLSDTKDPGACLAFTMPDSSVLLKAQKKVFAHYFYPFPLSIENKPADGDYYNAQYLTPQGENGKHTATGGYLRQRPLPVSPNASAEWRLQNVETEVRMAIARGITGFTIDVMSGKEAADSNSHLNMLLNAAKAVDPRFKIVVMPDISALKADANAVSQIIAAAAASDAAYRLDDGRLVVSAFNAGLNPPVWWQSIFDQLNSRGIKIAFVPTFLGWGGQAAAFAGISHGFSDWGTATATSSDSMKKDPSLAHDSYGKLYMMPVDPQQYRPKGSVYWEAGNSSTYRTAWMSAIGAGADWVQLVTWSDFSESSQVEPYTDATLRTDIGTGFYNLTAYYSTWFVTGVQPPITHDVLYYFYRREPTNAASPAQSTANKLTGNAAAENNIELVSFLTVPGTVKISIGGRSFTQEAPAGISSFKVPTAPGNPQFALSRNGADIFSFQGPLQIYGASGLPSGVIDMTYWSGSASQSGVCAL
jgi:glycosyl hydrolase family 71